MGSAVPALPPDQVAPLLRAYEDAISAKRRQILIGGVIFALCIVLAGNVTQFDVIKLVTEAHNFTSYFARIFTLEKGRSVFTDVFEWFWGLDKWLLILGETILIAYLGTVLGFVGGFCLCFLAAANLNRNAWLRFAVKRYLEFCRTVPELVFALIFVIAFGLGPVPGVLAIALHTMGALGKQFMEVVENIDMKPVEGAIACGGSWTEMVRFAVVPQVLSNLAGLALLRFEVNVRGAAVMGFVGAGGIGQDLLEAIRKFYYSDVSALLLLIIATVMIIDIVTEKLRHQLIGREAGR